MKIIKINIYILKFKLLFFDTIRIENNISKINMIVVIQNNLKYL